MKRFSFEADMKKGQCSCCPLLDWSEERTEYICSMTGECIPLEVDPQDCPLEEYHGIEWHKYPQEKPNYEEPTEMIVTVKSDTIGLFTFCSEWQGKDDQRFAGVLDYMVIAWAELPEPYKEEE